MQARHDAFRGILKEVAWEYGAGAPGDVTLLLDREKKRLELEQWAESAPRSLPIVDGDCIQTFLDVELDLTSPRLRGLGRMTDEIPRAAGRHRARLRNTPARELAMLREHLRNQVLCGYLFARLRLGLPGAPEGETEPQGPRLFQEWIPLIYSEAGSGIVEGAVEADGLARDMAIWCTATERPAGCMLRSLGIEPDDTDRILLLHYFQAGVLLALLESGMCEAGAPAGNIADDLDGEGIPADLFNYGRRPVNKLYVVLNGSLMAWVTLAQLEQHLNLHLGPF